MSTRLITDVSRWLLYAQFWVLPGVCIVCGKPSGCRLDLCPDCRLSLAPVRLPCLSCGTSMPSNPDAGKHCGPCLLGSHYSDHACMAFGWEEPASSLISQFKYRHRLQNGKVLATLLAERIRNTYQDVPLPQLLVPVPLHGSRLRARGYNQSVLIARELKRQLAIPVCMNLVKRVRPTIPQQGLSARERKQNLRGAFAFDQKTLARMPAVTSVAIIDDVVTTMTTADSVARLLRSCMPEPLEIHLWALARA